MNTTISLVQAPRMPSMTGAKQTASSEITPVVFVVDDDVSVRESLEALIAAAGYRPEVFASAEAFLAHPRERLLGCLVLDVSLPDLNGLELQKRLADEDALPIIFITGHGDIPMTVRAMKAGAVEFLTKPYGPEVIVKAIANAVERSRASFHERAALQTLRARYSSLTPRERQVMSLVVRGLLNKQVGGDLGITEITVKAHRGRLMAKMGARSLPELVNMADRLGQPTAGKTLESRLSAS
ncbi:MAG TPA: response regulator [Nitrospiraceae bacterium]|nr:response regulator [Nitrospiraceae bacterium]